MSASEAAAALGRIRSERKTEAARANAKQPRRKRGPMPEATKEKIRAAALERAERLRAGE